MILRVAALLAGCATCLAASVAAQVSYQLLTTDMMVDATPIPAWAPSAKGLAERFKEIESVHKAQNPDNNPQVFPMLLFVSARSGTRVWLGKKEPWSDEEVRFAVGTVSDIQDPHVALEEAKQRALKKLGLKPKDTRYFAAVDWHIDDDGLVSVLVAGRSPGQQ